MSWFNTVWLLLDITIIVMLIPTVIMQRRESGATLAWILIIVFLPFIGLLAFWFFGAKKLHMQRRKRRKIERQLTRELHKLQKLSVNNQLPVDLPMSPSLLHLTEKLDDVGPQPGNEVTILRQGPAAFDALEAAFEESHHHIHLIYYIWEPDDTGARLRDALIRACQRGVTVRLLLDDVGSRSAGQKFFKSLLNAGGHVERFLPVNPLGRQLMLNNRNHRKIVVVDGAIGFTGSMNIGDVYAGLGVPWRDLHSRLSGPIVSSLQEVFCQDWFHATDEDLVSAAYFPQVMTTGKVWAQLLASGPADERWRAIHTLLFSAINQARHRVWIETPYFVPDPPIVMALQTAALSGVDVRLLLPGLSDHQMVLHAGRSFYHELLEAGVKIFEVQDTIPHTKTVTIDSVFSTLGSANMDQRSFRLNFEANAFFYSEQIASELERDFHDHCSAAKEVTKISRQSVTRSQRLIEGICRVLAPLL
jgi:cardiolipin synthase